MLRSKESNVVAYYYGPTEILCREHDYKKFPGLNADLVQYADNWKGKGWDDIKVNVEFARGTKIVISEPTVKPESLPADTSLVIAQDSVRNLSSEPFQTVIELTGTHTDSISATVESEFSQQVGVEIGAEMKISSATTSVTVSTTARKGHTETSSREMQYRRSVVLKVPPKSAYSVKMTAEVEKRKASVTLPSKIQGPFRIQYPHPRDGHLYWTSYISNAARNNNDQEKMVMTVEEEIAVNVFIVTEELSE